MDAPVSFRFADFVLSPRQRRLLRNGSPVPLIPKYFDLLLLLVSRRRDAVSKQAIFDEVWRDVVVSDGALSQAVRTLRRTLGDNPREPRFIRTVSRHGYQFVWIDVVEESDEGPEAAGVAAPIATNASSAAEPADAFGPLVARLLGGAAAGPAGLDDARDAAERLHALGAATAIAEIVRRPDHARAVALLRDARWNVPGAGDVPLDAAAALALVRLRLGDAGRQVALRWANAAAAGAGGGVVAGIVGGLALYLSPASSARPQSALALAAIGALAGGLGAAGVGAGIAAAEVLARSRREPALAACGALAGAIVGALAHLVLRALLEGLLGVHATYQNGAGGFVVGFVIGGAAALGYAMATRQPRGGGMAAPAGARRLRAAATVGLFAAAAAAALASSGYLLVGGLINEIAGSSPDAQLVLAPLGRLIGEPDFGLVSRTLLSALEGGMFGFALAWGMTKRPTIDR